MAASVLYASAVSWRAPGGTLENQDDLHFVLPLPDPRENARLRDGEELQLHVRGRVWTRRETILA